MASPKDEYGNPRFTSEKDVATFFAQQRFKNYYDDRAFKKRQVAQFLTANNMPVVDVTMPEAVRLVADAEYQAAKDSAEMERAYMPARNNFYEVQSYLKSKVGDYNFVNEYAEELSHAAYNAEQGTIKLAERLSNLDTQLKNTTDPKLTNVSGRTTFVSDPKPTLQSQGREFLEKYVDGNTTKQQHALLDLYANVGQNDTGIRRPEVKMTKGQTLIAFNPGDLSSFLGQAAQEFTWSQYDPVGEHLLGPSNAFELHNAVTNAGGYIGEYDPITDTLTSLDAPKLKDDLNYPEQGKKQKHPTAVIRESANNTTLKLYKKLFKQDDKQFSQSFFKKPGKRAVSTQARLQEFISPQNAGKRFLLTQANVPSNTAFAKGRPSETGPYTPIICFNVGNNGDGIPPEFLFTAAKEMAHDFSKYTLNGPKAGQTFDGMQLSRKVVSAYQTRMKKLYSEALDLYKEKESSGATREDLAPSAAVLQGLTYMLKNDFPEFQDSLIPLQVKTDQQRANDARKKPKLGSSSAQDAALQADMTNNPATFNTEGMDFDVDWDL